MYIIHEQIGNTLMFTRAMRFALWTSVKESGGNSISCVKWVIVLNQRHSCSHLSESRFGNSPVSRTIRAQRPWGSTALLSQWKSNGENCWWLYLCLKLQVSLSRFLRRHSEYYNSLWLLTNMGTIMAAANNKPGVGHMGNTACEQGWVLWVSGLIGSVILKKHLTLLHLVFTGQTGLHHLAWG